MPRRSEHGDVNAILTQIRNDLTQLSDTSDVNDLRDQVLQLVKIQHDFRSLSISLVRDAGIESSAARERIRLYLCRYVGEVIHSDELLIVSGITDYQRRIRELRVEQGYQIASGASPDRDAGIDLLPEQYLMITDEPDEDAARRWHIANRIRKQHEMGSKQRLLAYLSENVGRVVTTEELAYVAGKATEFGRRVRELRTEDGFMIATRFTGRPDLQMGQYVMESLERTAEQHDRHIPDSVQKAVYERDRNTCVSCGWNRIRWTKEDPRILELHHVEAHAAGGSNAESNLAVLCSRCHDDVHAGRIRMFKDSQGFRCERVS